MIDIIFPIYVADNENADIQCRCFASFLETVESKDFNIIIVDNGSIMPAALDAQLFADVYFRVREPLGFAKAVNIGWKLCENDIIIVANNDLTFKKGWLGPLLDRVADHLVVAPSTHEFEGESKEVWSSCFMMRRTTREMIGFFNDVDLKYRYHDQDYWIRAKKMGIEFRRLGNSVVDHVDGATFHKMPKKNEYIQKEEQWMRNHHGITMANELN